MKMMIENSRKQDNQAKGRSPEWVVRVLGEILKTKNIPECKQDIVTVRVQLVGQGVSFLNKVRFLR